MADTKISALTDGVTANAGDQIPVARTGANRYITPQYIFTGFGGLLAAATLKATPVGADRLLLSDSEASGATKGVTLTALGSVMSVALSSITAGTGAADLHSTGNVTLRTDDLAGAGNTSALDITTGDASAGNSGDLSVGTGTASGAKGTLKLQENGGNVTVGGSTGTTHVTAAAYLWVHTDDIAVDGNSKDVNISSGSVGNDGNTGGLYFYTNSVVGTGSTGDVEVFTGETPDGTSGDIKIYTGSIATTQGAVILQEFGGNIAFGGGANVEAKVTGTIGTVGVLVSALPTPSFVGARALVTDALAPAFGATVAGTGAIPVPVYWDGSNWKVG